MTPKPPSLSESEFQLERDKVMGELIKALEALDRGILSEVVMVVLLEMSARIAVTEVCISKDVFLELAAEGYRIADICTCGNCQKRRALAKTHLQ